MLNKIKDILKKIGSFINKHRTTVLGIAVPAIMKIIAKEWGLDLDITKKPDPPKPKPKTIDDYLNSMECRKNDPLCTAIMSFLKTAKNTYSNSEKISAAEAIFNVMADCDSLDNIQKTLGIKALDAIIASTYSSSVKRTVGDLLASVAALKVKVPENKPEEKEASA